MVEKILVDELTYDPELYPRMYPVDTGGISWQTVNEYAEEMRAGAKFPPINVGIIDDEGYPLHGRMLISDGVHRWKACKKIGLDSIEAEVKHYDNKVDFLIDSTIPNNRHGRDLTWGEKARLYDIFQRYGLDDANISRIILVTEDRLIDLKKRILKKNSKTKIIKSVTAKALENGEITKEEAFYAEEKHINTRRGITALKQLVNILRNNLLSRSEETDELISELKVLLAGYID